MKTKQMQEAVITGNALGRKARIAQNQITDAGFRYPSPEYDEVATAAIAAKEEFKAFVNGLVAVGRADKNKVYVSGDSREIEIANRSNILNISVFSNGDGILMIKDLATAKKHTKRTAFYRFANSGGLDK